MYVIKSYYFDYENEKKLNGDALTIHNIYDSAIVTANYSRSTNSLNLLTKTTSNKDVNETNVGATINFNDEIFIQLEFQIKIPKTSLNNVDEYDYSIYGLS